MSRTFFALLVLSAPAWAQAPLAETASAQPAAQRYRLAVGAQLGAVHPFGVQATATTFAAGRPRFDVDLLWEPSGYLQSYSVGGAYHVLDSVFFVGPRVRWLQWHWPLSRAFNPRADNHLGLGLETGVRAPVAFGGRLLLGASLGITALPTAAPPAQLLANVNVSLAWAVLSRSH